MGNKGTRSKIQNMSAKGTRMKDSVSNSSDSTTENDIFTTNKSDEEKTNQVNVFLQENGVGHLSQKYSATSKEGFTRMQEKNDKRGISIFAQSALGAGGLVSRIASERGAQMITLASVDGGNKIDDEIFKNYEYPFTNLVFEGGGNKGMAYVGALEVLEDVGISEHIIRVAGASVGAITASLFAVGFRSKELKEFMNTDLKKVLVDHKCGYCSLLPNVLTGFGWNPGKKLLKWFGETLRDQTGNADITFREVYKTYGCELCIVVTNLSQMSTEYFHPKTTPNTAVRTAVRMSAALPGVFQSVRYSSDKDDVDNIFVDGGLLCNYPIHAFDGWWLSMKTDDSFFKKLQPLEQYASLFSKNQRFGSWNEKTLGIMLYSHSETELMKEKLAERLGKGPTVPKQSKLYRSRRKVRIQQESASQEHKAVVSAVGRFMKELHRLHFDLDGTISIGELRKVYETSTEFTVADLLLLFGHADIDEAFSELDRDDDGEVTFQELMSFVERRGVNIQTRFLGYTRKEINNIGDFLTTLQTALAINVKRNYVEERDIERTIGIDTDYIEANDFYLEQCDKDFLLESGGAAARAFLRHYCKTHLDKRKKSALSIFESERNSSRYNNAFLEEPQGNTVPDSFSEDTLETRLASESPARIINITPDQNSPECHQSKRSSSEQSKRTTSQQSMRSSSQQSSQMTSVDIHVTRASHKSLRRTTPSQIDEESDEQYLSNDDKPRTGRRKSSSDVSDISLASLHDSR